MQNKEKIAEYGKLNVEKYKLSERIFLMREDSVYNKERMRRLQDMSSKGLAVYTIDLMDEHSAILNAFKDAPVDEIFAETDDGRDRIQRYDHSESSRRQINAPNIGKLCLSRTANAQAEVLGLYFSHGGDEFVTHEDLRITSQRRSIDFRGNGSSRDRLRLNSPFSIMADTLEMGSVSEESNLNFSEVAKLEDRVETLRVVCDVTGIVAGSVFHPPQST